jgi:hypothetical protein
MYGMLTGWELLRVVPDANGALCPRKSCTTALAGSRIQARFAEKKMARCLQYYSME